MNRTNGLRFTTLLMLISTGCVSVPQRQDLPTVEEKISRIMILENRRSSGNGELLLHLEDAAGRVRARAALALGRVEDRDAIPNLTKMLLDQTSFVRSSAAFSLGLYSYPLPEESIQALLEALHDDDEMVRARSIEALGKTNNEFAAESIARALSTSAPKGKEPYEWKEDIQLSFLSYPRNDLRMGLFALAKLQSLRWSWDLLATQGSTPRYVWWPAAWAAGTLNGNQRAPLMLYYAGSKNPEFRLWSALGLASLNVKGVKESIHLLLSDPNEKVRIAAVRAAASLNMTSTVPDLLLKLEQDTRYVQAVVLEALSTLDAPTTIDALIDHLGSKNYWIRSLALSALAHQDPEGFWLLLSGLGQDRDWQVRASLADLLGTMNGSKPLQRLLRMVDDPDSRVRASALSALARFQSNDLISLFIKHLTAQDPYERLAAAKSIAEQGNTDGAKALEEAFHLEESEEPSIKAEMLEALALLIPDSANSLAERSLTDPNYLVRLKATSILRQNSQKYLMPQPLTIKENVSTFLSYVNPLYSPQAFIHSNRGDTIEVELFILDAPMTVRNFISLSRAGFYNGLPVHKVIPNRFIQTGDPRGDGKGGPGYTIRSEINERPIMRGTLAMANRGKDRSGSQFFIAHLPQPDLDGRFTVFGQVTSGMNTVDRIEPGDFIESIDIWDGFTSPHRTP